MCVCMCICLCVALKEIRLYYFSCMYVLYYFSCVHAMGFDMIALSLCLKGVERHEGPLSLRNAYRKAAADSAGYSSRQDGMYVWMYYVCMYVFMSVKIIFCIVCVLIDFEDRRRDHVWRLPINDWVRSLHVEMSGWKYSWVRLIV